jgi:hypothetical protein
MYDAIFTLSSALPTAYQENTFVLNKACESAVTFTNT